MNLNFTSRKAFTALIAAFILHNIEESISICRYPVESPFSFIQPASCTQFLWAVSILSMAGIVVYGIAMKTKKAGLFLFISTAMAATLLFNVFVPHVAIAISTFHYTPGLLSAIMLNLPVSLIVLAKNRKSCNANVLFIKQFTAGLIIAYLIFAIVMRLVLYLV